MSDPRSQPVGVASPYLAAIRAEIGCRSVEHANAELRQWRPLQRSGQDAARTTPRHTARSPAWSLTAPPNEPPATGPAPNSCPPSPQTAEPSDPPPASMPRPQSRGRSYGRSLIGAIAPAAPHRRPTLRFVPGGSLLRPGTLSRGWCKSARR